MKPWDPILNFWFAKPLPNDKLWFGKDASVDDRIRREFGSLFDTPEVEREWPKDPRGLLGAIILYDQFSRNAFRDTAKMFAYDEKARALARTADPDSYSIYEAAFLLLPFEHSESLADQDHSVAEMKKLIARAQPEERKLAEGYMDYAERHRIIIQKFGRFPHRNKILGRISTSEETEFLKQPGSSF
jgi:uncharacterized protein (DUF924 family)